MARYTDDFLQAIPKTDLHVHLDGSLRLETLIELARDQGVELPSYTTSGLTETLFKTSYNNLDEYLAGFAYTCPALRSPEALERAAYELVLDNAAEGVRYLEVRFAPQLLITPSLSFEAVMEAVDQGLRAGTAEANKDLPPGEPAFEYGIIVCAMRFFTPAFSHYYAQLYDVLQYSRPKEVVQLAGLELAKATVQLRDERDVRVVGFDLAGSEAGNPAGIHEQAYDYVHANFLKKTVHAGEAYGPESIFQAITALHADRIGHGLRLFNPDHIRDPNITDPAHYVDSLANFIADRRTTIEVCLTSNLQTSPDIKRVEDHSFGTMLDHRMSMTLCTDNRLVSHTTVTDELRLAVDHFDVDPHQLKNLIVYGFKRSFYPGNYSEKRAYVRSVIDYYDRVAQEHAISE